MIDQITLLDPTETEAVLATGRPAGKTEALLSKITDHLMAVVDTPSSVFATGLREPQINSLRTRMYRRDVQISVTKVTRQDVRGHIITAKTVRPEADE